MSSLGAQENHSLRGKIWRETGGLKWRWQGAAVGPGEEELAEGVAAAWKGLRWSWRWGLSWKDEPQRWQKKMRTKRR